MPRKLLIKIYALLFLCIPLRNFSQTFLADSLKIALKKYSSGSITLKDTGRVIILNRLSDEYINTRDFSTAMKYARIAQNISEKLVKLKPCNSTRLQLANSLQSVASIHSAREDFNNALKQYKAELALRYQVGNKTDLALCLNQVGIMYNNLDNLAQSLEYFFKALKTMEETGDEANIARIYNSLGIAFDRQKNTTKALEYYTKELKIGEKLKNSRIVSTSHSNMGTVLAELGKYDKALREFNLFLEGALQEADKYNIGLAYLNIGDIYTRMGEYDKALETNAKAMAIFEEMGNKYEASLTYFNQGNTYLALAKINKGKKALCLKEAKINLEKAKLLFEKGGQVDDLNYCYAALSSLDSCLGNSKGAFENYRKHILYRDSLLNQENTAKSVRAEMNYEFEKKETTSNLEQEKKETFARQENEKQKSIRNLFIIAFAFTLFLALFIFKNYHQKRKVNKVISAQKKQVEEQKWIVEKNQKQIIDSINYAKRIQSSMLPNPATLKKTFENSFIYYKPKDIVSGDFYWFQTLPSSEILVVLADCTGHGVPGAFLSMVGTTLLNEIVCHKNIYDPAEIIKSLNFGLNSTLASKKSETHSDGMDITICKINTSSKTLHFAGANQTLYILQNNTIERLESQVISIDGVFDLSGNGDFNSIERKLSPGTSIFMSTDGFADQSGEATGKKFMSSRFEKLLADLHSVPSADQLNYLDKAFNAWKGNQKQIDDILVIGFRV